MAIMETPFVRAIFPFVDVEKTSETSLRLESSAHFRPLRPPVFAELVPEMVDANGDLWSAYVQLMFTDENHARKATEMVRAAWWAFYQAVQSKSISPETAPDNQKALEHMIRAVLSNGLSFLRSERSRMWTASSRILSGIRTELMPAIEANGLQAELQVLEDAHAGQGRALNILKGRPLELGETIQIKHHRLRGIMAAIALHTVAWAERDPSREERAREILQPFYDLTEWVQEQRKQAEDPPKGPGAGQDAPGNGAPSSGGETPDAGGAALGGDTSSPGDETPDGGGASMDGDSSSPGGETPDGGRAASGGDSSSSGGETPVAGRAASGHSSAIPATVSPVASKTAVEVTRSGGASSVSAMASKAVELDSSSSVSATASKTADEVTGSGGSSSAVEPKP